MLRGLATKIISDLESGLFHQICSVTSSSDLRVGNYSCLVTALRDPRF